MGYIHTILTERGATLMHPTPFTDPALQEAQCAFADALAQLAQIRTNGALAGGANGMPAMAAFTHDHQAG